MRRFLLPLLLFLFPLTVFAQQPLAYTDGTAVTTVTCGSGTGITCTQYGPITKVTITTTAITASATTQDITLVTIAAKTKITGIIADLTQAFACTATCVTATLSFTVGKSAGGTNYILSADADAAAAQFELTAATTGADLVANLVQGGTFPSWASTTAISMRFTSAVGNLGTGSVTNLSQGSVTFYILTSVLP